ncbi:MAG TPA: hypothetical protein PLZ30_12605 [Deltaproteobacteria bacterium]|nr:hypothetical protein [Deltaproteobacteria bacterium]HRC98990.1 hypothetical protein [Deltaproteobacteria bacterium]
MKDYLPRKNIGVIQNECPETTAMVLMRNPQGRWQYNNIFFRDRCKALLKNTMLMVREFIIHNRYRLCSFIDLENSPTCSIHWGRRKINRCGIEYQNADAQPGRDRQALIGTMAEIMSEELGKEGISGVPFLEFPAQS